MSMIDIGKLTQELLDEIQIGGVVQQVDFYNPLYSTPEIPIQQHKAAVFPKELPPFDYDSSYLGILGYMKLKKHEQTYDLFFELNRNMTKIERYFIVERTMVTRKNLREKEESGKVLDFGYGKDKEFMTANSVLINFLYESSETNGLRKIHRTKFDGLPNYLNIR